MPDRSVVYRLRADVTQFKAQMASAAASVSTAADKMTAADKSGNQFRKGLGTLGSTAGKIGLIAAAGLGVAVVKAANFDQAMSKVAAATHESAGNMDLLRSAALKAGQDTVFSATEAASGIENLAKAGVSTTDILSGGLRGALDLAAAGNQSVGEAAETAATAMTQFGLSGEQIPHIADLLAAGAGKAQGEVSDLAAALKQGGLVAASMGLSIEDTTGTLAAFASAGLVGSDAGTSFKSMIQRLQNPLGQGAKAMERLGINAYDASGNFVGITNVAGQLQDKLGGLTQAQRDAALAQIFGSDAVRAANVLYQQGATGIQSWINKTNDSGYAAETAATKLDNLKGDLEQLGGALETALIGTGSSSQGPLRGLVQSLTDVVNAYNELPGAAKSGVGVILASTAAIGGSIYVFSKIVQGVAATRVAMDQLGISMGKTGGLAGVTGSRLGVIATKAAGVAAVGIAMGALADNIGRIDTSKIDRSLEALTRGESTGTVNDLVDNMASLSSWTNKIDLGEVVTLFGVFGDSTLDKQAKNIEQVDSALASMVEGGNIDEARASFAALSDAAEKQGVSFSDIVDRFPEYDTALQNAGVATNSISGAFLAAASTSSILTGATGRATGAIAGNTSATQAQAAAQKAARESAQATARSFLDIGRNANNAKLSLSGWIREMARSANDLASFANNAQRAANKGLKQGLIKQLQALGPEGARRMRQLANASASEIARANAAWARGQRAASLYTTAIGGGANAAKAKIALMRMEISRIKGKIVHMDEKGAAAARARIRELQAAIDRLKGKTIRITTFQITHNVVVGGKVRKADGGYISGPGGPREDRIPAMLSNGEFVVNAAATARNLELLHRINARKYATGGLVQHFADGGEVRRRDGGDDVGPAARRHAAALNSSTKAINREKAAREKLVTKRTELSTSVSDTFLTDPFATTGSTWAKGGGDPRAILRADIARAKTFQSQLGRLKKLGLDGSALAAVASTGDVGKAASLAAMGKSGVNQYESLYRQRAIAAAAVGRYAGQAVYGSQIASIDKKLDQLVHATHKGNKDRLAGHTRTGKAVGGEINRTAAQARRRSR